MKNNLEFDPYQPENIPLFETLYGKNLISLGGFDAIDNMFSGLNIQRRKALDLGFGLGGVAFYLAEKYEMSIFGIEINSWMAQYAKTHAPTNIAARVEFQSYNPKQKLPYPTESFDLVYSKGVLNHIQNKNTLLLQINKILKPSGLFVIADWIYSEAIESTGPLTCDTQDSYQMLLTEAGFSNISFRDDSQLFLGYIKQLIENLTQNKEFIEQRYGHELYSIFLNQHQELIEKINKKEKIATRIVAEKIRKQI